MPSSWKSPPVLQHYLAELHVLEALLLFSVYEERVTDHLPFFWHFWQSEVKVAFSASSSAHREHRCLCAAAELGNVLRGCSDNPWHSAARSEWFGEWSETSGPVEPCCLYELFPQTCS